VKQNIFPSYSVKYADYDEEIEGLQKPLQVLNNINGYASVVASWPAPCLILKEASSLPRVVHLSGFELNSICPFHAVNCEQGFLSVDDVVCTKEYD
jgi:hypothetical protein